MIIRRDTSTGANDLHVVYRPCTLDELVGNDINKKILKNTLDTNKVSHAQLFTGDAGTGKTTVAKIMALGLNCENKGVSSQPCLECPTCKSILNGSSVDIKEINVGQTGGKDYVDSLVRDLPYTPFNAKFKVLIFDEAHKLTDPAKDLLLKPLETGFDHVYFIFCTNQPEKLKSKVKDVGEAFLSRLSAYNFHRITKNETVGLLNNICEFEGFPFSESILDMVAEEAKGVPRDAIVWLNKISMEGSWDINVAKDICKVLKDEDNPQVIELFRALNSANWARSLTLYNSLKNIPIETIRISISGLFVGCLKRSKKVFEGKKYSEILDVLTVPIYEAGKLAEHKWYNYMFKTIETVVRYQRGN